MPADPIQTRPPRTAPFVSTSAASSGLARRGGLVPASDLGSSAPRRRGDNLFLWTVFLLGLVLLAMMTWVGTSYIFSNPERPWAYRILSKFKKLRPPARFSVAQAPAGEFMTPEKLFTRCAAMSPAEFQEFNTTLMRSFLRNYAAATKQPVPFLAGRFNIMDSYVLGADDLFPSGVVALAVSAEDSKVLIEHVYSAPAATAPLIKRNLPPGTDIELRRTYDLSAVVHATRLPDGHLLLTVVPLNYGSYGFKGTSSGFNLEPPAKLNIAAGFPMLKEARREEASQAFVAYRQLNNIGPLFGHKKKPGATVAKDTPSSAVTGIDAPPPLLSPEELAAINAAATGHESKTAKAKPTPAVAAAPSPTPAVAAAVATPKDAGKKPTPAPPLIAAVATPPPAAPPVVPVAPLPAMAPPLVLKSAPATNPGGVSLQPFTQPANSTPVASANPAAKGPDWVTYAPGKQPAGRVLRVAEVGSLGEQSAASSEPIYLGGQFTVSAVGVNPTTGEKGVVLRSRDPAAARTRIVARYPAGRALPTEGAEVSRDERRPFQITDVRRTADGQFNVFVREITTE